MVAAQAVRPAALLAVEAAAETRGPVQRPEKLAAAAREGRQEQAQPEEARQAGLQPEAPEGLERPQGAREAARAAGSFRRAM